MILTVGTRGSELALLQTKNFLQDIKKLQPNIEFKMKIIKTTGDIENSKPLFAIDNKGIFEKEIDQTIVNGKVDFAVHSLKDVPTTDLGDIAIAVVPKRASPNDVLISKENIPLKDLPKGATIGTGSLRRLAQVKFCRPDLNVEPIRGNVNTRISKVKKGEVDGIIIAQAGIERLKLESEISESLSLEQFPSAPGQGALAIVTRKDDKKTGKILKIAEDSAARAEVTAERSLMQQLGGGCRVPIGAVGHAKQGKLSLQGYMFALDGQSRISAFAEASSEDAEFLGRKVAEILAKQGAKEIEEKWREKYGSW